jgi:CrcB protein
MTWIAIAVGGALGSLARHAVNHILHTRWLDARFPVGTVAVNLIGCFVIGLLAGLLASERIAMRPSWREFVFVGVLGGFTTFSAFGLDTFTLARAQPLSAVANVVIQVAGGLAGVWLGYYLVVRS